VRCSVAVGTKVLAVSHIIHYSNRSNGTVRPGHVVVVHPRFDMEDSICLRYGRPRLVRIADRGDVTITILARSSNSAVGHYFLPLFDVVSLTVVFGCLSA